MKLIIVGATGMIGGATLRRAISEPAITSIVALTRRELPEDVSKDTKTKSLTMQSFDAYPDEVLEELKGAEICIWSMGGRMEQFPDAKTAHLANVDYLLVAAKAFAEKLAPALEGKKFRFVYCSGALTARDPNKKLLFLAESRRLKGEAENGLLEVEKAHPDSFEVFIARPAGVLEANSGLQNMIFGPLGIGKGELACAMVDIALNGAKSQVTESLDLRAQGRELLKKTPSP